MPLPTRLPSAQGSRRPTTAGADKSKEVLANRFLVESTLGSGNCGTALLVTDLKEKNEKDKQKVAKKIFIGNLQPDETVDAAREANLLRNLNCPGIVKFYESFVEGDYFCIVTEYCEGGDLDDLRTKYQKEGKKFAESVIIEWIIQILLALDYMHRRNIFLRNGMCKIGDFGISRILMGSSDMASTFVGTPYYMSPEVLKHEGYNSKSDIWSVGCILYDLVALTHPFQGTTLMGVMFLITEGAPPDWPEDYSDELHDLFLWMLEKDPMKRPSAGEALRCPFVVRKCELMKSTLIQKQARRDESADVLNQEAKDIADAFLDDPKLNRLISESEKKRLANLPPRDRYRILKELKAEEERHKLSNYGRQQLRENTAKRIMYSQKNDPYQSTLQAGGSLGSASKNPSNQNSRQRLPATTDFSFGRRAEILEESGTGESSGEEVVVTTTTTKITRPPPGRAAITNNHRLNTYHGQRSNHFSDDSDEESGDVEDRRRSVAGDVRAGHLTTSNLRRSLDADNGDDHASKTYQKGDRRSLNADDYLSFGGGRAKAVDRRSYDDDRPITPMKNKMVYNKEHSSLDFEDEIPDTPDLADTYYTQFDDFVKDDDEDNDEQNMMTNLQSVLNADLTLTEHTIVADDMQAGAFGPGAREIKIRNLRAEAHSRLGIEKFNRVYDYLKKARFDERPNGRQIDEKRIMSDLKKITQSSDDCYLVENLLFLEVQERDRR